MRHFGKYVLHEYTSKSMNGDVKIGNDIELSWVERERDHTHNKTIYNSPCSKVIMIILWENLLSKAELVNKDDEYWKRLLCKIIMCGFVWSGSCKKLFRYSSNTPLFHCYSILFPFIVILLGRIIENWSYIIYPIILL